MADLFPGCTIFDPAKMTKVGSLGCFVTKGAELYAITALHVVTGVDSKVFYGWGTDAVELGRVVQVTNEALDAALIHVNADVCDSMGADNFLARIGGDRLPMFNAAPATDLPLNYIVRHAGRTSAGTDDPNYVNNSGTVAMNSGGDGEFEVSRLTMEGRRSREGDSGGPVLTSTGTAVGFISLGLADGGSASDGSTRTRIVHFGAVMAQFSVIMATWANRNTWRPPSDVTGLVSDGMWTTIERGP